MGVGTLITRSKEGVVVDSIVIFLAMLGAITASVGMLNGLWAVFFWLRGRTKITYYPPENRFTQEQGLKAYRLTHDEWMFKYLGGTAIYDWKLMLLDIETSHVLAVSTGEDDAELVRTYLREAPKYETPLEPHQMTVVPVGGAKYPMPWGRET